MNWQDQLNRLDLQKCLGVGVLLAAVYYFVFFNSGAQIDSQIQQSTVELAKSRDTLDKVKKAFEDQKKFQTEIIEINKNMKDFQKYFSTNMTVNDLLGKVSGFAEKTQISVNNLKPGNASNEFPEYPETVIEFEVEGTFHNIMEFVSQLTQMNKAIDFKIMEFKIAVAGDFPVVKLKTVLVVYNSKDSDGNDSGNKNG